MPDRAEPRLFRLQASDHHCLSLRGASPAIYAMCAMCESAAARSPAHAAPFASRPPSPVGLPAPFMPPAAHMTISPRVSFCRTHPHPHPPSPHAIPRRPLLHSLAREGEPARAQREARAERAGADATRAARKQRESAVERLRPAGRMQPGGQAKAVGPSSRIPQAVPPVGPSRLLLSSRRVPGGRGAEHHEHTLLPLRARWPQSSSPPPGRHGSRGERPTRHRGRRDARHHCL
jgi:hypothetical protein